MRRARGVVGAIAAAMSAAACGDATGPPAYTLQVLSGDDQTGLVGWQAEFPVRVRVLDARGAAVPKVAVRFGAESGGGSPWPVVATTGYDGVAWTQWRLGTTPGPQTLRARLGGDTVRVQATAMGLEEADVVVARGALGPLRGVVLSTGDGFYGLPTWRLVSDTVIPIPPTTGLGREVVLFGEWNRPVAMAPTWTAGVDTVHLDLAPPVEIDIEFEIKDGYFSQRVRHMETQLAAMERIWERAAAGITLGQVTFVDSTGSGPVHLRTAGICSTGLAGKIEVTVVTSIDDGKYWGWGCASGNVYLAGPNMASPSALNLLAHEVGHTFGLGHTDFGLMHPNPPGDAMTTGEVFRSHFGSFSSLNRIFHAHPAGAARSCGPQTCLEQDFKLDAGS